MARNEGTFPPYVKLDINPDSWPNHYWESARKCDNCGDNWPNTHLFTESPCCGSETTQVDAPPERRWPEAVRELLFYRFGNWYIEYDGGTSDEDLVKNEAKQTDGVPIAVK